MFAEFWRTTAIFFHICSKGGTLDLPTCYIISRLAAKRSEMVPYLAQQGVDREKADNNGRTPPYVAALEGHFEAVRQYDTW